MSGGVRISICILWLAGSESWNIIKDVEVGGAQGVKQVVLFGLE